jgi:uncharacterized membrane protein YgcG
MKHAKWVAAGGVAAVATLLWPGTPAGADTSLGGYSVDANASIVHIEVFEPTIPIPASPQGDFSLGYSAVTTESGTARATASYLWPGSVIGDGFDELTNQPGTSYPVQVNSRFPATPKAPKTNQAQLTKGNGMTTSTNGFTTKASVTGLGIDSKNTNPTDGLGAGLGNLGGGLGALPIPGASSLPSLPAAPSSTPVQPPKSPVPVPAPLADLVSVQGMTSTSQAAVGKNSVTSTAGSASSEIDLLGGIVSFKNVKVISTIATTGKKTTNSGKVTIGAMSIAGKAVDFGHDGFTVTDKKATLPTFPAQATATLKKLGISFKVTPLAQKTHKAKGTFSGQAMIVTINTVPLRQQLDSPLNAIAKALGKDAATQLAPLLQLRPKLVLRIGEAMNSASAFPAYVAPPIKSAPPVKAGGGAVPPATGGSTGGSTGGLGGLGGGTTGGGTTGGGTTGGGTTTGGTGASAGSGTAPAPQAAGLHLPGLAEVPRLMILGALAVAAAIGWALQTMGGAMLGGAGPCQYGLRKGVPDLRKG